MLLLEDYYLWLHMIGSGCKLANVHVVPHEVYVELLDKTSSVAQIRFECTDFDKLKKILNVMPQSVEKYFELSKNYIVLPNEGFEEEENSIYTIKFSVHPASIGSKIQFRKMMNQYLREIYKALENVQID